MRQLPLAALNFESAIGLLPTGHELISGTGNPNDPFSNDPTSNGWGWRTKILPYMDQGNLNTLFDLTLPIADPVNRELAETVIPNFSCPSDPTINDSLYFVSGSLSMSLSNYLGNGGSFEWSFVAQDRTRSDGILLRTTNASHQGIPLSVVDDGTSNTFFCGETVRFDFIWDPAMYGGVNGSGVSARTLSQVRTGHGVFNPDPIEASLVIRRNSYVSKHPGGANFSLVDGSTRFISDSIEHNQVSFGDFVSNGTPRGLYQRLFSRNDGLPLDDF